jgi:hypothetical protein
MATPKWPAITTLIVGFFREHTGKLFCNQCLSARLFNGRRIDLAMRHIEVRGIKRQYDRCSECGKPRLVAGVLGNDSDADFAEEDTE